MISYEEFEDIVVNILKRDISSNKNQQKAILSDSDESLFIVAGPGSGKTTVMVLKILKYIFVDDINPSEILATTFTRKAAEELYSRILGWGDEIKNHLLDNVDDFESIPVIDRIDFNQIKIGTTDSIAEELLRDFKKPGENQAIVIEEFVANSAMMRILIENETYLNKDLVEYLKLISGRGKLEEPSKMSEILMEIKNRLFYDEVDIEIMLDTALKNNEIPQEVKDKYSIKPYVRKYDLTQENIDETLEYINMIADKFESEEEWKPREFTRLTKTGKESEDTFYCNTLCNYRKKCKFIKDFNEKKDKTKTEDSDLF